MQRVATLPRPALCFFPGAILLAALCAQGAFAKNKKEDKKAEKAAAEILLAKSRGLSDIEAPGSPPFELSATIHFEIGKQAMEGQGQIIWSAPDHYREAYTAPNYFYTEIVRDGYRYLARTNNEMPLIIYELHFTLARAIRTGPAPKDKIKKIEAAPSGTGALTCMSIHAMASPTYCLDESGDVMTVEADPPSSHPALNQRYEFSNFVAFGAKRFPEKIVFRGGDGDAIEVDVKHLAAIESAPAGAFDVPADAMKEPACVAPKMDRGAEMMSLFMGPEQEANAFQSLKAANASLYLVIAPDGRVRSAALIHSSKPVKEDDIRNYAKYLRFPPLKCGHEGIEYQIETALGH